MKPLVSIQVPTYNSERTLEKTLKAIKNQTYKNIEIIIIDGYSKDRTLEIAKKFKCKIIMCKGGLLEARIIGAKKSNGDFVLFIDSDQIIRKDALENSVRQIEDFDYLWLYERAHNREKLIPSLYDADRRLTQKFLEEDVVLPRFFKKEILIEAINKIPKELYKVCRAHEHLIIFHELKRISKNMGPVGDEKTPAVEHIEPDNLVLLIKKQYRWGKTTKEFESQGFYLDLVKTRNRFRKFHWENISWSIKSFILRILRGAPYKSGQWFGK